MSQPRLVEVRRNVLKQNDVIARALREQFHAAGVFVVSLVSSPGSGKTTFLEKTLTLLQPRYRVAALVGDLATENDAVRLARSKAPVKQITTGTLCHLEAAMVQNALQEWDLHELDFLFIVLMSVTEGEDKPLKYPTIFNSADVAVISKNELAAAVEFDWDAARTSIESVRPGMKIFRLSAKTGEGMEEYLSFLSQQVAEQRAVAQR